MEPVGHQDLGVGGTPSLQHGKMTSQFVGLSGRGGQVMIHPCTGTSGKSVTDPT